MFISYAQNFEDVMLWRALKHVDRGFYVDVGAQDPIVDSVSMGFYERGWRGVHVEPVAIYADMLRAKRPEDRVVQAALGAARGMLQLFEVSGTGLSTASRDIAQRHAAAGFPVREVAVECLTLDDVLVPPAGGAIHWLKIDVEGYEREVLQGWQGSVKPWIVVVESTLPSTQVESQQGWETLLLGHGYTHAYFDGLNRFYVSSEHTELLGAFRHGPTIFDGFALSGTATAPFSIKLASDIDVLRQRVRESSASAHQADTRARQADDVVAAMTGSLSWRLTTPVRWLGNVTRRGRVASRELGKDVIRGAVGVAKRTGVYARVAPWVRERYPGAWARAKRSLLTGALARGSTRAAAPRDGSRHAPVGNTIPHDAEPSAELGAIAARGTIDVRQLQSLLEQEIARQRKA